MSILPASLLRPQRAELPEVRRASRAPQAEEPAQPPQRRPATDAYIPSQAPEPSGRYWPSRTEDGNPGIYFDDPEGDTPGRAQPAGAEGVEPAAPTDGEPEAPEAGKPSKDGKPARSEERCKGSTDKVDREIKRLRKRREELAARLRAEDDPAKAKTLERQLAQVENELRQKDNDAYRRQHTQFTQL